jgi:DNA-binding transcriptional regulator GbsR (MarR family)
MENYKYKLMEMHHARLLLEASLFMTMANREAVQIDGWSKDWQGEIQKTLSEAREIEEEIKRDFEPSDNEKALKEAIIEILDNELDRKAAIEFGGYTLDDPLREKLQRLVKKKAKRN